MNTHKSKNGYTQVFSSNKLVGYAVGDKELEQYDWFEELAKQTSRERRNSGDPSQSPNDRDWSSWDFSSHINCLKRCAND